MFFNICDDSLDDLTSEVIKGTFKSYGFIFSNSSNLI